MALDGAGGLLGRCEKPTYMQQSSLRDVLHQAGMWVPRRCRRLGGPLGARRRAKRQRCGPSERGRRFNRLRGRKNAVKHVRGSQRCSTSASLLFGQRHLGIYIAISNAIAQDCLGVLLVASAVAVTVLPTVADAAGAPALLRLCCGFPRRGVTVAAPCAAPCSLCCAGGCAASFSAPCAARRRLLVPERVGELISACVASVSALPGSASL